MPPLAANQIESLQTTVVDVLRNTLTLTGVPLGPISAATFAAEAIFRVVRLVQAIKQRKLEIETALDRQVRDRDILREPIYGDLEEIAISAFFGPGGTAAQDFPDLVRPLRKEVQELNESPFVAPATKRTLWFAFHRLRPIYQSRRFADPFLEETFGTLLDTNDPNQFGSIARDAALLLTDEAYERGLGDAFQEQVSQRATAYFQTKLRAELTTLGNLAAAAQEEMNAAFRDLVLGAIVGSSGFAARALTFAKEQRKLALQEQIRELDERIAAEANETEKKKLQTEKTELQALLNRLG